MPLLLTMSLFGSVGTLLYIILLPFSKKYLSVRWRRIYLICNILEYLIPFPYYRVKYKELLETVFVGYLPQKSVEASLYIDDTTEFIQITTGRVKIPNVAIYVLITGIVITGVLLFYQQIRRYQRIKHFLRDDTREITNREYNRVIQEHVSKYKMEKYVRVYKCKDIDTPFTIGIIRPIIVLPDIEWLETELEFVMEHEITHIRHKDNLIKMVSLVMLALNFCNPLAYFVLHEWNVLAELSCDDKVISHMTDEEVKQYGFLIIKMAEERTENESIPIMGFNMQEKIMKERIRQMKRGTRKVSMAKRLLGICIMGVALFSSSFTVFAYSPKNAWVVDDIGDEIIFCEEGAVSWGNVYGDLPVGEDNEWVFISENGEIVEAVDGNDIGTETYSACNHNYVSGELAKHTRNSDGSCKIEYYKAQRCSKCGNYIIGNLKNTVTYATCPH